MQFVCDSAFELCMYNHNLKCQEALYIFDNLIYYNYYISNSMCYVSEKKVITVLLMKTIKTWVFP